jgi:hypothetical protein
MGAMGVKFLSLLNSCYQGGRLDVLTILVGAREEKQYSIPLPRNPAMHPAG